MLRLFLGSVTSRCDLLRYELLRNFSYGPRLNRCTVAAVDEESAGVLSVTAETTARTLPLDSAKGLCQNACLQLKLLK